MTFRRPCLIHSWAELVVWTAWLVGFLAAGWFTLLTEHDYRARIVAGTFLAFIAVIAWRKFWPRIEDMRRLAYRTRQGMGVVLLHGWISRADVERGIERAVAIHGNGRRLQGVAIYVVKGPLHVLGERKRGVAEVDITVAWDDLDVDGMVNLITHEVSHLLLDGHPDAEHETMRERGTL